MQKVEAIPEFTVANLSIPIPVHSGDHAVYLTWWDLAICRVLVIVRTAPSYHPPSLVDGSAQTSAPLLEYTLGKQEISFFQMYLLVSGDIV